MIGIRILSLESRAAVDGEEREFPRIAKGALCIAARRRERARAVARVLSFKNLCALTGRGGKGFHGDLTACFDLWLTDDIGNIMNELSGAIGDVIILETL